MTGNIFATADNLKTDNEYDTREYKSVREWVTAWQKYGTPGGSKLITDNLMKMQTLPDPNNSGFRAPYVYFEKDKLSKLLVSKNSGLLFLMNDIYHGGANSGVFARALRVFVGMHMCAAGPKVFFPTHEECEALEEIELRIPVADYAQPFPVFTVEFPESFAKARSPKGINGIVETPLFQSIYHDPKEQIILGVSANRCGMSCMVAAAGSKPDIEIEDDLNRIEKSDLSSEESVVNAKCFRIAINASLLLLENGFRADRLSAEDGFVKKLRKRISSGPTDLRATNSAILRTIPTIVEFTQTISIRSQVGHINQAEHTATGTTVRPHLRRAHWRMVRHGVGKAFSKRMFFKHVFVNKKYLVGETPPVEVNYK